MSDEIAQAPKEEASFSNAVLKDNPNLHTESAIVTGSHTYGM